MSGSSALCCGSGLPKEALELEALGNRLDSISLIFLFRETDDGQNVLVFFFFFYSNLIFLLFLGSQVFSLHGIELRIGLGVQQQR